MEQSTNNNRIAKIHLALKKKLVWIPLSAIAAICTIVSTYTLLTKNDYKKEITELIVEIGNTPLVSESIPDTLNKDKTIIQTRKIQDNILLTRSLISSLCIEVPQRAKEEELQRYMSEFVKLQKILSLSTETNRMMIEFVSQNPQYSQLFNLKLYQDNTDNQATITKKWSPLFDKINRGNISDEDEVSLIKDIFQNKLMKEYINLKNFEQKEIFDYLNIVQKEIKSKLVL